MPTFEDVVVEGNGAPGRTGNNGAPVADAITSDGKGAPSARARGSRMQDKAATGPMSVAADPLPLNSKAASDARVLPQSVRDKLVALAKANRDADDDDPDEPDDVVEDVADTDEPDDGTSTSPAAKEPEKIVATSPEWEKERDELKALADRQRGIIEKLRADASKAPPANDYEARLKRLDEAEETYVRAPVNAFKAWLSATNGLDPDSDDFKKELLDFYIDLTSAVTEAEADSNHQAKRSSALIRREWDRSNKKRQADEQRKTQPEAPDERTARLEHATNDVAPIYSAIAAEHPYLTKFSVKLKGEKPEAVIANLLLRGLETGDFDATEDLADATKRAAKLANDHFKRLWNELKEADPDTSTAKPDAGIAPAADATAEREKTRQGKGTRVTNADASVAPAAPPAIKPNEPEKRKFRDDDERKRYLTRKHLGRR